MYPSRTLSTRGVSFVDVLVACAIIGLVFGGIFGVVQVTIKLIGQSKAKAGALAIANEQIEYTRSLLYADVGTVAGIPSGSIPQISTTTLNGISYTKRTLIEYVDSPDDGTGGGDANGILADYKEVKIEVSWSVGFGTSSLFLLTNIVPPGIETTDGGGTLTVNVFDANVDPLSGAQVRIYNNTTTSTIDVTKSTNVDGVAMFSGAPAAANYQITVSDTDFSTDQTYSATTSNPSPITPHVAVVEGAVSTMNFQIDELSDLTVRTVGAATYNDMSDTFDDNALVFFESDIAYVGGEVHLTGGPGIYPSDGEIRSTSTTPASLESWNYAAWQSTSTAGTSLRVSVYMITGTSTYTLVPDSDLPTNSAGFSTEWIDLRGLDTSTYPTLALGATLQTTDVNSTPVLGSWELVYTTAEPPIAFVDFSLRGNKVIGMSATATPVYKYTGTHDSGASGQVVIPDLEWDVYDIDVSSSGYAIREACESLPYALDPGDTATVKLTLTAPSANSLRVHVVDGSGNPIPNATVELSRAAFSDEEDTSPCGQAFFNSGGLVAAADYQLLVHATGYSDDLVSGVNVSGDSLYMVTMSP